MEKSIWNLTFNFTSSYPTNPSSLQLVLRLGTFFGSHGLHTTPQCWKGSKRAIIFFGNVGTKPISHHKSQLYHILVRLTGKKPVQFPSIWMLLPYYLRVSKAHIHQLLPQLLSTAATIWPGSIFRWSLAEHLVELRTSGKQSSNGPRQIGTPGDSGGNRIKDLKRNHRKMKPSPARKCVFCCFSSVLAFDHLFLVFWGGCSSGPCLAWNLLKLLLPALGKIRRFGGFDE